MQARTSLHLKGIDISHWNGAIDFNAVKNDGINSVYIKATEGIDFVDSMFQNNVTGARKGYLLVLIIMQILLLLLIQRC
jgi:lysozyme